LLVDKKNLTDEPRFVVNYTKLNKVTKKDAYPLPLIQDIFDQLQGKSVFSTLDLKSGFFQIPLSEEDSEKTAFVCHCGLFEFTRMPMGLCNSPSIFQRTMEKVLQGYIGVICMIYMDDIVIFSNNKEEHVKHLQMIFDRLREHGITLNPKKCVFGMSELKLLGYIINSQGIKADPEKTKAISELTAPGDVPATRSFLGMTGYYRLCMSHYAHISEPLVALTRKNARFTWGVKEQEAFDSLKNLLVSDKVIAHPQVDKPYKLYTDACDYAVGGILCQDDSEGVERPVVYLSKQLSPTQRKWAVIEKEAYALVYALTKLRPYLWGAEFTAYTDHKPLTSLFTKEMNNTKIQRWAILLAEYGCKVQYKPAKSNIRAHMLSRIKPRHDIATIDTGDWVYGDEVEDMEVDDDILDSDTHSFDISKLQTEQQKLPEWEEAVDIDSEYDIVQGMLYSIKRPYKFAADHPRLVLPPYAQEDVIKQAHIEVGHMGSVKTMRKIQESYVWPGMLQTIKEYIDKCPTCIVHRTAQVKLPLGEMPQAQVPVQIIGADLIGPFVQSPEGNVYALTIIDHCTGWAEVYPIPKKTNEAVWNKFRKEDFPRHGHPQILITDQGQEFNAHAFRDYLKRVGVEHRRTTSYNPESNGKAERFNKTFKSILVKLVNNNRDDWEDQLGVALSAYNNATSTVTGHTPYFLHYGRRARLPLSMSFQEIQNPLSPLEGRLEMLAEGLKTASELTKDSRNANRDRLAQRTRVQDVKVGDAVVIKANEPLSLTSKWDPQWTVTQVRGKVLWVRHEPTGKTKVLNRNKVHIVDPDISWDEVRPRPIRKSNVSTKKVGVSAQPQTAQNDVTPAATRDRAAGVDVPTTTQPATTSTRRPRRRLPQDSVPPPPSKRTRIQLPRAAKRKLTPPSPEEQKRARLEVIACVSCFSLLH